jgi:anti-anti-sigma factor
MSQKQEFMVTMIEINVSDRNPVTLVEVSGRVDSMNANEFGEALTEQIDGGNILLVLDLSSVEYMSSAGLREIVTSLKKAKKAQGKGDLRLAQPSQRVREVLEMAGLDTIFRIYPTQDDAINSFLS